MNNNDNIDECSQQNDAQCEIVVECVKNIVECCAIHALKHPTDPIARKYVANTRRRTNDTDRQSNQPTND